MKQVFHWSGMRRDKEIFTGMSHMSDFKEVNNCCRLDFYHLCLSHSKSGKIYLVILSMGRRRQKESILSWQWVTDLLNILISFRCHILILLNKVQSCFMTKFLSYMNCLRVLFQIETPLSLVLARTFQITGTKMNLSSAYHPQTDRQTKSVNRILDMYVCCSVGRPT